MTDRNTAEAETKEVIETAPAKAPINAGAPAHGTKRGVAVTWSIGAALFVMVLIAVVGGLYVATKLDEASKHARENLELIEKTDRNVGKLGQALLPMMRSLNHLKHAVQFHGFEFEMLVIDTDRDPEALATASGKIQQTLQALDLVDDSLMSEKLLADLKEYTRVMVMMTDELLATEDHNERFDLLYDAEDMQQQLQSTIRQAATQLEAESKRWTHLASANTSKARHNVAAQHAILRNVEHGAGWSLGVNLLVVVAAMLLLYRLLDRRLGRVVAYAKRIADGDLDAHIEVTSKDKIGGVAEAVGRMGRNLAKLVSEGKAQTEIARKAQAQAEQENWTNESLRLIAEAIQEEAQIEELLDQAVGFLYERLDLVGAWVRRRVGDETSVLAVYGDGDDALVGEVGTSNEVSSHGDGQWTEIRGHASGQKIYTSVLNPDDNQTVTLMLMFAADPSEAEKRFLKHAAVHIGVSLRAVTQSMALEQNNAKLRSKVDQLLSVVSAAAKGDLTKEVKVLGSDAIGQMGDGLQGFLTELRHNIGTIALNAQGLTASSEQLTSIGQQISDNAETTSDRASAVSAAAGEVSNSVETVAAAAEQMNASIRVVADSADAASSVATQGVEIARTANATVAKLGESSNEIGNVIKMITTIAEQTNLLALNATIEAARAGEAGKGFAVVANEVKDLAKETGQATDDISRKIEAIQVDTRSAVEAIEKIGEIIGKIHEIQEGIASGVEQQATTTDEIMRVLAGAATGSAEIAHSITSVSQVAQDTLSGATQAQQAAVELSKTAVNLQQMVGRFSYEKNTSRSRSDYQKKLVTLSPQTAAARGR